MQGTHYPTESFKPVEQQFDDSGMAGDHSDREWMIEQVQAMRKVVAVNESRVRQRPGDTFLQAMLIHHKRTLAIFLEGVRDFVANENTKKSARIC